MQSTQITGTELLEILDSIVETESDYYEAMDKLDYYTELAETASAVLETI